MSRAVLLAVAACYSPHVAPGSPCGPGEPCPTPLSCSATQMCELGASDGGDASPPRNDGAIDAAVLPPDGPPGSTCYGTGVVRVCFAQPLTGIVNFPDSTTLDTASDARCTVIDGNCVISAATINLASSATVGATGSRPLVLIGAFAIMIAGTIDASSHLGGSALGPAANSSACIAPTAATGFGGGAGGSFGGAGGPGGSETNTTDGGIPSTAVTTVTTVRGGCAGGTGAGTSPVGGGAGGGAVYLISTGTIAIDGTIDASGAGAGGGSPAGAGGGAGGSGGMIGLDAPTITLGNSAAVFANGGGGGEGGGVTAGSNGTDPRAPTIAATGGTGGTLHSGDGGDGAAGATTTGMAAGNGLTGGGGGGGAGVIKVYPLHAMGSQVSPAPS